MSNTNEEVKPFDTDLMKSLKKADTIMSAQSELEELRKTLSEQTEINFVTHKKYEQLQSELVTIKRAFVAASIDASNLEAELASVKSELEGLKKGTMYEVQEENNTLRDENKRLRDVVEGIKKLPSTPFQLRSGNQYVWILKNDVDKLIASLERGRG